VTIRKLRIRAVAFCVAGAFPGSGAAWADEVKVMISGGFVSAYRELGPQFEAATGRKLITVRRPAMSTAASAIQEKVSLNAASAKPVLLVMSVESNHAERVRYTPCRCQRFIHRATSRRACDDLVASGIQNALRALNAAATR
jgi:ABC-type molybdate transport system substrate-binding protein